MSMEVKKTNKWNNIVQLVKLRWQIVFERVWLAPFLAMFVADFVMATTRGLHKGGAFLYDYGSLENLFIVISMAKILSRAWNILIEKEVSVFPGTIQTRYCSRILYDLSEIFLDFYGDTRKYCNYNLFAKRYIVRVCWCMDKFGHICKESFLFTVCYAVFV